MKIGGLLQKFRRDSSGAVALIFAVCAFMLVGLVGLAIDYSQRQAYKSRLDSALDAAALTGIQVAQYDITNGLTTSAAITDGQARAQQQFLANAGAASSILTSSATVTVSRTSQTLSATASYSASVPTSFGKLFNISTFPISGSVASTLKMGQYLSFYLMVDVSGSMGLPSTNSGQTALAAVNPDNRDIYPNGCTFACHFSWASGYDMSRNAGNSHNPTVTYCPTPDTGLCIQLRVDAVAYAVQQLVSTAQATATLPNQYSIGLYPFIAYLGVSQALTTNLATVSTVAAGLTGLLDTGNNATLGSGGTHFENALPAMNTKITSVGDGSSAASPKPFVFLVTDGAEDPQYQSGGSWWGGNSATTLDESNCTPLKNRGITIAVLYIPYLPIQNPTNFAGSEDFYANANIPNIPAHLQACASPGFHFTANSPSDINNAMQTMFAQSVQAARLSQ